MSLLDSAPSRAAPPVRRVVAQLRMELVLTLRRGESVLLTFLIPVLILVFFTIVDILPTGTEDPVDFLLPGVLTLAVISSAMTGPAIATGFERSTGVLKRLGLTPLSRGDLLTAKLGAIFVVEALQVLLLLVVGFVLGWRPEGGLVVAAVGMALATVGFVGIGMMMAGTLPALTTLAVANGAYLILLFLGGVVVPLDDLPTVLRVLARALPSGALSDITHGALQGGGIPVVAWLVLLVWAVAAPIVAARLFRWE